MELRKLFLPYCLERQNDGSYVILNRKYKPIGFNNNDHVEYDNFPIQHKLSITAKVAKSLSWNGNEDTDKIFLYGDSCIPTVSAEHWKTYSARLERMAHYTAKDIRN